MLSFCPSTESPPLVTSAIFTELGRNVTDTIAHAHLTLHVYQLGSLRRVASPSLAFMSGAKKRSSSDTDSHRLSKLIYLLAPPPSLVWRATNLLVKVVWLDSCSALLL